MWTDDAWGAMRELAASREDFTADDLRARVGEPDRRHTANGRNNSIGSIFRQAAAAGMIEQTGRVTKSRAAHRKGGMIQLWRGTPRAREGLFG